MWFSGLRGGVAFALASVSYTARDFPQVCGGITGPDAEDLKSANPHCQSGHYDSLAILQTTMLIAVFTIFVFGGSITSVAISFDVLDKKGKGDEKSTEDPKPVNRSSGSWSVEVGHNLLLRLLTNEKVYAKDAGVRFDAPEEKEPGDVEAQREVIEKLLQPRSHSRGSTTLDLKRSMTPQQLDRVHASPLWGDLLPPFSVCSCHDADLPSRPIRSSDVGIGNACAPNDEGRQGGRASRSPTWPLHEAA